MISISLPSEFEGSQIPKSPGVYFFKDEKDEILYVGKAANLRSRVRSYFSNMDKPAKTHQLVSRIRNIDWIIVDNEVEALLLENKLIKQHAPKYNISLKDSKTFAYIAFTKEPYPRVLTSRKISPRLESFGPYTDGFMRQDLTRLVVRVFKLRVCKTFPKRFCLNYNIGLCTAPCAEKVTQEQYAAQVEQARTFLKGQYGETIETLNSLMKAASDGSQYERALELRNQIASIQLLNERQIVDNERSFDQDVMVFRRLGEKVLIVQMGIRKGVLLGKKEFTIDYQPQVEKEFLKAFYTSNQIPHEILLNSVCWRDSLEKEALEQFFSTKREASVKLVIPKRGDRLSLVRLAEKNIESNLDESSVLTDLQAALNLPAPPKIIECFDVSNLGEEHIVSGMVRFTNAKPDKRNYRRFKMKTVSVQDDLASVNEAVTRRYRRLRDEKAQMPDLIVVDGGSGQVGAAEKALQSLGLQLPLIGLSKENEEIHLPDESFPKSYPKNSRMILLLRQIRDAAHSFSIGYNRKRRQMKMREEFNEK
jgi:excinuclease ABC subunit C